MRGNERSFQVVIVWTGDLPPPADGYGSYCRTLIYDASGEMLYEGNPWPAEVRGEEDSRVSQVVGGFSRDVRRAAARGDGSLPRRE